MPLFSTQIQERIRKRAERMGPERSFGDSSLRVLFFYFLTIFYTFQYFKYLLSQGMSDSEEQVRVAYLFIPAYTPPFPSEQVPLDTLIFSG